MTAAAEKLCPDRVISPDCWSDGDLQLKVGHIDSASLLVVLLQITTVHTYSMNRIQYKGKRALGFQMSQH